MYSLTVFAGAPRRPLAPFSPPGGWLGSGPLTRVPSWPRAVAALACLLALLCPLSVASAAEPAPEASELAPGQPWPGPNGERGVWWPLATAQRLAQDHMQLSATTTLSAKQAQKITLLEERLELRLDLERSLELQVKAFEETIDGCAEREATQVLRTLKAEERLSRARWIWTAVGVGITALVLGGVYALASNL